MASGGARARSGPPPDPEALRRERDRDDWTTLPVAGRVDEAPRLPLPRPNERERELWLELWALPQALQWEQLRLSREVALYVRRYVEAEKRGAPATLTNVVRQLADSLGISVSGMNRNKWRVGIPPAPGAQRPRRQSVRDRLTVVKGGEGAA